MAMQMTETRLTTPEPVMVDVKIVARMLGCSPRHVVRLQEAGAMPAAVKLGRLSKWNRKVIEQWIADGCPAAPAKTA